MIETKPEPVIVCTKCGMGYLNRYIVPEDFRHSEPTWLAPSLKAEGPHCNGEIKIVTRVLALRVADVYGETAR